MIPKLAKILGFNYIYTQPHPKKFKVEFLCIP